MEEKVICPWCGTEMVPEKSILKRENGNVRERRCTHCKKVLAAYLVEEGDFMSRIRKFQN